MSEISCCTPQIVLFARVKSVSAAHHLSLRQGAQGLRHPRPHAEPALEAPDRLMRQHAEPVGSAQIPRAGGLEQAGFERRIDKIGDHGARNKRREVELKRRLPRHAERGGVHEQLALAEPAVRIPPVYGFYAAPELGAQSFRAVEGSVDDADALNLA